MAFDYDCVVIGSGFGGSVATLRLAEKGYRALVMEQGKRLNGEDFPTTNWDLKRWMWWPALGGFGLFRLTIFRHVTVLSGVGVGGGSLVYANTLPVPKQPFFSAASWAHLADWEAELRPHYRTALTMLGAVPNPRLQAGDLALRQLAREIGKEAYFEATDVAVYFGEPGEDDLRQPRRQPLAHDHRAQRAGDERGAASQRGGETRPMRRLRGIGSAIDSGVGSEAAIQVAVLDALRLR